MILASAFPLGLSLSLAAAAGYAVSALGATRLGAAKARLAVRMAWLLHALLLAWGLWGDAPRFGFAPALSMTAWLVAGVYAVESHLYPLLQTRWSLCALGAAAVLLAALFPGYLLHANASPWLPLHWALGIASYGLMGVAVVHAWLMTRTEGRIRQASDPHSGMPLLTMERLTFRFVGAGFILLTATLLLGFVFEKQLYGPNTQLKWDHKTAFSVLSWGVFATLLLGRARFGWRGKRAVRVLYVGSLLLLLAYVGSRFVLEVVLGRAS
jgi:ABC-type uncharacterized transport system permease subunit